MDDNLNQNNTGQFGLGGLNIHGKLNQEDHNLLSQYSIPGILHFIQHEWTRFEVERTQWEVERAELQARIAFLQGERKGQENLKNDLIRRIKMLEYALKQERIKFHKLKYGTEPNFTNSKSALLDEITRDEQVDGEAPLTSNSNVSWKHGRQLLRQYLQEIGYTDTIIDVRSSRVRKLLGLAPNNSEGEDKQLSPVINGEQFDKRTMDTQKRNTGKKVSNSAAESTLLDAEASVLATFDFLASESTDMDDDDDETSDDASESGSADEASNRIEIKISPKSKMLSGTVNDAETDEVLAAFDFLGADSTDGGGESRSQGEGSDWDKSENVCEDEWGTSPQAISKLMEEYHKEKKSKKGTSQRPRRSDLQAMLVSLSESSSDEESPSADGSSVLLSDPNPSDITCTVKKSNELQRTSDSIPILSPLLGFEATKNTSVRRPVTEDDSLEATLGLGELAGLTISNEAESSYDVSAANEVFRKTWSAKYTLRSHFDGVRALTFHPVEPVLITAAEDHTLKLWNLQKTVPAKKAAALDVEPVYTFRGHIKQLGPVCTFQLSSVHLDSKYQNSNHGVLNTELRGHTDAVWDLAVHTATTQLLSCAADGSVKLWSPHSKSPLLNTYTPENVEGNPTSVDFVRCDPAQIVASYTSSNALIYDIETGKPVIQLEIDNSDVAPLNKQINKVVSHPTLPLTVTAHEDRHIRFFDNTTGKLIHSMVAHLDAVTSLAIDPNGLYLLSGSHDCSIRLWNMDSKTCVQEITSHRKKFDEAIYDVAFHASKPYIASAGADALAKVFV
ncbi:striatin-3-like [Limulus polyphemus]|uniref:Striatin-3-like n=1 Tax=Limulus polyphemus TaxID=6850 RepID=A0ABM1BEV8_LIMPO|nr:striatin-3-like [Limulus polyphemus]